VAAEAASSSPAPGSRSAEAAHGPPSRWPLPSLSPGLPLDALWEARCHHCDLLPLHETARRLLDSYNALARDLAIFPPITSGYRCPVHNAETAGADPTSWHQIPAALDLGGNALLLANIAKRAPAHGFVSVRRNERKGYVHLALFPERQGGN